MYNNRVRNIELPENLFSNLGEIKSKKIEIKESPLDIDINNTDIPQAPLMDEYQFDTDVKLTNYSTRKEYRDRIDRMYEDIKEIIPVDNEIDNVLYFNNYVEKGIVVKPKVSSLKQFWTEYRLISNEKASPRLQQPKTTILQEEKREKQLENNLFSIKINDDRLDSLDELFDALSKRVSEINDYIEELKEMRINIDKTSKKIEADKEKLENERSEFNNYKQTEENKINKEKENLKINFDRLQTIINDLDKKLVSIDQDIN